MALRSADFGITLVFFAAIALILVAGSFYSEPVFQPDFEPVYQEIPEDWGLRERNTFLGLPIVDGRVVSG